MSYGSFRIRELEGVIVARDATIQALRQLVAELVDEITWWEDQHPCCTRRGDLLDRAKAACKESP